MLTSRLATEDDLSALRELMATSADQLQRPFLDKAEIVASRDVMGLDTQLVADRTYFMAMLDGRLAGCGGWSMRATLYGGDHSFDLRDAAMLDPQTDAARIRAMYTHPDFVRRGVGRYVLGLCEAAAVARGFRRAEMMATLAGEPLYAACGYREIERVCAVTHSVPVAMVRMGKALVQDAMK
jgi:GNAT superfamily N-acetyltransferase